MIVQCPRVGMISTHACSLQAGSNTLDGTAVTPPCITERKLVKDFRPPRPAKYSVHFSFGDDHKNVELLFIPRRFYIELRLNDKSLLMNNDLKKRRNILYRYNRKTETVKEATIKILGNEVDLKDNSRFIESNIISEEEFTGLIEKKCKT